MKTSKRMLLFAVAETEPATFAELSFRSRMSTDFLQFAIDSLVSRGFVELDGDTYTLAGGIKEHLLNITEGSAVNT